MSVRLSLALPIHRQQPPSQPQSPPHSLFMESRNFSTDANSLSVGVATSFAGDPPLVAIPGVGVVIRDDAKPAIEPMGRCLADVMRRVEESDPLVALTDEDVDRLVNWDAEKYRQTLKV